MTGSATAGAALVVTVAIPIATASSANVIAQASRWLIRVAGKCISLYSKSDDHKRGNAGSLCDRNAVLPRLTNVEVCERLMMSMPQRPAWLLPAGPAVAQAPDLSSRARRRQPAARAPPRATTAG